MSDEPSGDSTWSRERWFLTISIIFAVQVVIVIWLSGREVAPEGIDSRQLLTHYYSAELSTELAPFLNLMDPTIYARAHRDGFSGSVWLNVEPIKHRSAGWSDPPQFLKFNPEKLLSDLDLFGRASPPQRTGIPSKLTSSFEQRTQLSSALKPARESSFRITGELNVDDLKSIPDVPSIEFDGVLAPSVVSLQVDQRGRVFSANLTGTSGNAKADQRALKIGRSLQFKLADGFSSNTDQRDFGNLRRARLTVYWWTVPVPVINTNAPAGVAPVVGPIL